MDYENILNKLKKKIESSKGLSIFAKQESKFENWVQVELCGILSDYCKEVIPEKYMRDSSCSYDIDFDSRIAIELKIFTNNGKSGSRNVEGVIKDVKTLSRVPNNKEKIEILVVFPTTDSKDMDRWGNYLNNIETKMTKGGLGSLKLRSSIPFSFEDKKDNGLLCLFKFNK